MPNSNGGGQKYVFLSNYPDGKDLNDKVLGAFMRKAFLSDAVLYFVIHESVDEYFYIGYLSAALPGRTCKIQVLIKDRINMFNLITQSDYYIAGNNPDEWLYLETAATNGIKIIGLCESEDEMFEDIKITPDYEAIKNTLRLDVNNFFAQFPPTDYEYFLIHNGLGETLGFFYWIEKYREIHKKKIIVFCISDSHLSLMKLSPYVDGAFRINALSYDYVYIYCSEIYRIKNWLTLHADPKVLEGIKRRVLYNEQYIAIIMQSKDFLEIPPTINFERYEINLPESAVLNAQKIFDKLNLVKGRTVFLVTEGISHKMPHMKNFWIKLAQNLRENNFEVVTNSKAPTIPNCKNIFIPLEDTAAFIGLCGNVVSQTTGFTESICSVNSKDKINLYVISASKKDAKPSSPIFWFSYMFLKYYGRKPKSDTFGNYLDSIMGSNINWTKKHFVADTEQENETVKQIVENIKYNLL